MKHLIIIGVGGFAREVYWHAQESLGYGEEWNLKGFLDGDVKLADDEYKKLQLPVLGDINNYKIEADDVFICAVAEPHVKEKLVTRILERGGEFINVIHKTACVYKTSRYGIGVIMSPFVNITDHVTIGNYVTFNNNSGLGHDAVVGDYCTFNSLSGLMGCASTGKRVFFANGAQGLPHSIIEDDVYVGIKSVVFKRAKAGTRVFGNPAMPF